MIDDGPAFESAVQLRVNLFGEPIVGAGTYSQAGQGSGQTRATLQFRMLDQLDSQPQQSLVSICDGRFIYRLHQNLIDGQRSLEFYDLTEIQRAGGSQRLIAAAIPIGPGQLMTGGVAGLLKQLSEQFEFTSIATDPTVSANQNVHTLRGTWKPPQLHRLLQNHPDSDNQRAKTWDQLPANLPHAVEIVLAETELAGLFPKRVIFYQFTTKRRVTKARPIVAFQFADPRPIPNHSPDLFVMKSDDLEATDVTQQYLSRLQANESNALR